MLYLMSKDGKIKGDKATEDIENQINSANRRIALISKEITALDMNSPDRQKAKKASIFARKVDLEMQPKVNLSNKGIAFISDSV
jgi:hypothetical protein